MRTAIVVGSGAGGATAAKELQGSYAVTILEAGREFHPFGIDLSILENVRRTGVFFDSRAIPFLFPPMRINRTRDMVIVKGICYGGTTTLATANALRMDGDLKQMGFDLDAEFQELLEEVPTSVDHQKSWRRSTRTVFESCRKMSLDPQPTPKMVDYTKCKRCGRCVLGCPEGAKWDTRRFLTDAVQRGARLEPGCRVERVLLSDGKAVGVEATQGWRRRRFYADRIILAAGGLGTPVILQDSGIACESRLFVDPVLCVAAPWKGAHQNREIPMPFVVQRDGFIISPYFDFVSFFFDKRWRLPAEDIMALMIKLADSCSGTVSRTAVSKALTSTDNERLQTAVELCREILINAGASEHEIFLGTLNAGHPGGMLPLTREEVGTMHHRHLPANLYVADATLLPHSLGNPPILTIMALAKRISKVCRED